jgi:hypothetical protein
MPLMAHILISGQYQQLALGVVLLRMGLFFTPKKKGSLISA